MATVMLFLQQTTGKTERHTHFCMPLEPVFTRDCGGRVHFTDEPTGALDSVSARQLLALLTELNGQEKATVLMVTHDPLSASYGNRVLFLKDGQINKELRRVRQSRVDFYHTEQFPLQFGDQILIFDDVVLVVATDMDSVYVFIRDGNGIADKENGL